MLLRHPFRTANEIKKDEPEDSSFFAYVQLCQAEAIANYGSATKFTSSRSFCSVNVCMLDWNRYFLDSTATA